MKLPAQPLWKSLPMIQKLFRRCQQAYEETFAISLKRQVHNFIDKSNKAIASILQRLHDIVKKCLNFLILCLLFKDQNSVTCGNVSVHRVHRNIAHICIKDDYNNASFLVLYEW